MRSSSPPISADTDGAAQVIGLHTIQSAQQVADQVAEVRDIAVSVIIPHYNDLEGLRVCYTRLEAQTWPRDDFEIVVADNNSACGITAVQSICPNAIVVPAPIQGAGPARNAAVAASRGRVLAFVDSDCVPDPHWISEGLAALDRYDFIGGKVETFARNPDHPNPVEAYEIVFNFNFRRYIEKVGFTGTGNMFVPRTQFDRVGGFRTGVAEDMEWCFRATALGYRLGYVESAVVGHPARADWMELQRRWVRLIDQHFCLALETRFGRLRYGLKALAMPPSIVPHIATVLTSARLKTLRARVGAIMVLTRLRVWRSGCMLRLAVSGRPKVSAVKV